MARNTGPRGKRGRRLGIGLSEISGKPVDKDPLVRRPYPPGQHGPNDRANLSEFAVRLREKQRLKFHFELLERQCHRYFAAAKRLKGNTGNRMLDLIERRIDAVVFRSGLASSIREARQFVRHGHVRVDGTRVDIPSFIVRPGATLEFAPGFRGSLAVETAIARASRRTAPAYLETDLKLGRVRVLRAAEPGEVPLSLDMQLIVEFYAQRS